MKLLEVDLWIFLFPFSSFQIYIREIILVSIFITSDNKLYFFSESFRAAELYFEVQYMKTIRMVVASTLKILKIFICENVHFHLILI